MNNLPNYTSDEQILRVAKSASNHRIGEYNIYNRPLTKNNKGVIGQIVEEGIFHYPVNSRAEPDFAKLGVELKVTGLKQLKNKSYNIKERLVLNIINYETEYNKSFEESSFYKKNLKLLLMFYLYDNEQEDRNFMLIDSILHRFMGEDLQLIKHDWQIISDKINAGRADEISEADTMYLAACTKGATSESSYRNQPGSNTPARQRAYCLKASYMNSLVKKYLIDEKCTKIMSIEEIKVCTFEIAMKTKLKDFLGKSETELFKQFGVSQTSKSKFNLLTSAMLGINGDINNTDEFKKAGIQLKTIRIEENGSIKENMSFPHFDYCEIVKETWETQKLTICSLQLSLCSLSSKEKILNTISIVLPFGICHYQILISMLNRFGWIQ